MGKLNLPYLHTYFDRHKKERANYRRGKFSMSIKHPVGSEPFLAEYWAIHNAYKEKVTAAADTFGALVEEYYASPAFTQRTANTKEEYKRHLEDAREMWATIPAHAISRRNVLLWRDARLVEAPKKGKVTNENATKPHTANAGVEVLRALFNWAIQYEFGKVKENPALKIKPLVEPDTDGWEPWPKAALRKWAEESRGIPRYAFFLALMTGQRRADVLSMTWDAIEAGGIHVHQMKSANTKQRVRLWIPIHAVLQVELDKLKKEQIARYEKRLAKGLAIPDRKTILQKERVGGAYNEDGFGTLWNREQHRLGLHFPFHGLRKNATMALLEAGCTPDQAKAITGHMTQEMLDHYGRRVNQKKLAKAAINLVSSACFFEDDGDNP